MKKLILEECLFHGLKVYGYTLNKEEEQVNKFKKIVTTGYIASRKYLKDILTTTEYDNLNDTNPNWNGDEYVSITPFRSKQDNFPGHYGGNNINMGDTAYNTFIVHNPAIILKDSLLGKLSIRKNTDYNMLGEIQIEDKIPFEYFVGISLPDVVDFDGCLKSCIKRVCDKKEERPDDWKLWYEADYQRIVMGMRESTPEEMAKEWYKSLFLFEETIKSLSLPLKVYEEGTGKQIAPLEKKMYEIEKMKKKVLSLF